MAVDLTLIKLAAVTGISLVWVNFTVKAFKLGWHIALFSLEKEEEKKSLPEIVMCEECQKRFLDDENVLIHERFLCEGCRERN